MDPTLKAMASATHYREWLWAVSAGYVGDTVLEVGAGLGTMTECLLERRRVVALEFDPSFAERLTRSFEGHVNVEIVCADAAATPAASLGPPFDSAVSYNVFEHIDDDLAAARNVHDWLAPGGFFICFVPALMSLYGELDRSLGHQRRYTRSSLARLLGESGFEVVELRYFNLVGFFAWGFLSKVLRRKSLSDEAGAIGWYDRTIVPLSRRLESRVRIPFGQSLLAVGRKPMGGDRNDS